MASVQYLLRQAYYNQTVMAYIIMTYIVMAYIVMVYIVMAYIVMAYTVIAYIILAYIVMAYIVMANSYVEYLLGQPYHTVIRTMKQAWHNAWHVTRCRRS